MIKHLLVLLLAAFPASFSFSQQQYASYVEAKTSSIDNEKFGIVRLLRKDNHVKVKYFAAKDNSGSTVYERYQAWAVNKKVIAFSSGTYMDNCNVPSAANPVGLCIDQGNIVNNQLVADKLDALAIVYATGGMAASDLTKGDLKVTYQDGTSKTLDIRGNSYQKAEFVRWAEDMEATVFQTHLFVFNDQLRMGANGSTTMQERRFLAACKADNGNIIYYIINLPTASTLYKGAVKAYKILKEVEQVDQVVFMINLDTGCQNVFSVFNEKGIVNNNSLLKGNTPITNSINLLAYYYE